MPKVFLDRGKKEEKIRYDSVNVSGKFIQIYDDLYKKLAQISSPCAIHLLFWMALNMDRYNQISMNKRGRGSFISDMISNKGKRYSDHTVKFALRALAEKKLIISMGGRGQRDAYYFVTPFHFWRTNSQRDRVESIKAYTYKLDEK